MCVIIIRIRNRIITINIMASMFTILLTHILMRVLLLVMNMTPLIGITVIMVTVSIVSIAMVVRRVSPLCSLFFALLLS